ncbi:MAG: dephospho-CoA kinase [Thermoleophilaceae bacterium]|nr:dephospho-CoA kinase [Thermoleophilaceae bacterium]MEA2470190.1 dephospho-CoA kinase [Thermoleophilaceae bacterium]
MAGRARVPFVGLTGGIAAGKSEALQALERIGAATLSTDSVVHELLTSGEVRDMLVERFGDEVAPNGEIDRGKVADVVFGDDEHRKWLEELLWPRVGQRMVAWREEQDKRDPSPRVAVVEVPLLFESGMEAAFDKTIAVVADESVREARAGTRGHRGVESRTSRQLAQDEKARRADIVVRNDGTLEDLELALSSALAKMES